MSVLFTISVIASIIAMLTAFAVVFKKQHILSNSAFSIGLFSTAIVIIGDSIILNWPDLLMQWKKTVFIIEIVMVSTWLLFAVSYGRKENWSSFNNLSKLLFFLSPLLKSLPGCACRIWLM